MKVLNISENFNNNSINNNNIYYLNYDKMPIIKKSEILKIK